MIHDPAYSGIIGADQWREGSDFDRLRHLTGLEFGVNTRDLARLKDGPPREGAETLLLDRDRILSGRKLGSGEVATGIRIHNPAFAGAGVKNRDRRASYDGTR